MRSRNHPIRAPLVRVVLALLVATFSLGIRAEPVAALIVPPIVNPCDLPGADLVCDVAGDVVGGVAGAALLVLAAWSPFALLRIIPMMEMAAASVVNQRSSMSGAAQSAGISTPATYMRQAMDRHSRASASPASPAAAGTIYSRADPSADRSSARASEMRDDTRADSRTVRESRSGASSGAPSGTIHAPPRPGTSTGRTPSREEPSPPLSPPAPPRRPPPPEQSRHRRPPDQER